MRVRRPKEQSGAMGLAFSWSWDICSLIDSNCSNSAILMIFFSPFVIYLAAFLDLCYYNQTRIPKEKKMEGTIEASYIILCENDTSKTIPLKDVISNEKIERAIKSEFAKGLRNISLSFADDSEIYIKTNKEIYKFRASKNDFADLVELAEEDARKNKRIKKKCEGVELVNIVTVD
jgi:hypothetical protein